LHAYEPVSDALLTPPPSGALLNEESLQRHRSLVSLPAPDPAGFTRYEPSPPRTGPELNLPGYEILRELGRGGMGVVYLARQKGLGRLVALKMILHADYAAAGDLARFRSEAEAVARLQHPNIVSVFEVGEAGGVPFFSMEYLEGGNLARRLEGSPQAPREAAALLEMLARAVHAAHEKHVIHRDLKPANVLFTADNIPKIVDFGLAKRLGEERHQTQSGAILGTPGYMAPEQAGGKNRDVGPHTDVYSLGAILYELLTGRPPFQAPTALETVQQVVTMEPLPPHQLQPRVPRDLETICLKCLSKQPVRRYSSAAELADDLERFLRGEPVHARPITSLQRFAKWVRRHPAIAFLVVLLALTMLISTAIIISLWIRLQAAGG
jgi:serine/threonine protein kinase